MVASEMKIIKVQREFEKEREVSMTHEKNAIKYCERVDSLEEALVQMQNSHDTELLEWEIQQSEYEKTIAHYEEERDRLYLSTTAAELKSSLPDRNLPIGEQLEIALKNLIDRSRQIKFLSERNKELDESLQKITQASKKTNHLLNESNEMLRAKQKELDKFIGQAPKVHSVVNMPETDSDHNYEVEKARLRETNALKYANETVESLQIQLAQKNELIDKYRKMVQSVRDELAEKTVLLR
jgi:galactokinase